MYDKLQLAARVRKMRQDDPYITITRAVAGARFELSDATPKYAFLAKLDVYPPSKTTGNIGDVKITIRVDYDEDAQLGEDDVTGWFTDTWEEGCIKNTVHYNSYGQNGQGYKWYRPANYRLGSDGETWEYYWRTDGMSKSAARERVRQLILRDMQDDADRQYLDIRVKAMIGDMEIGSASLGWIDVGDDPRTSKLYLIECCEELIHEAISEAEDQIDDLVEKAERDLASLRAIRERKNQASADPTI